MESITSKVYKAIKTYLRQKTYRRLTTRPRQSRSLGLGQRSWRVRTNRPTIKLQSKVNSRDTLLPHVTRSYTGNVLVFLSGGEGGLIAGSKTHKKFIDDELCHRQSTISRQVSVNDCEFKRKMMLNVHIPALLPLRRSTSEGRGFSNIRPVNSFRISIAA